MKRRQRAAPPSFGRHPSRRLGGYDRGEMIGYDDRAARSPAPISPADWPTQGQRRCLRRRGAILKRTREPRPAVAFPRRPAGRVAPRRYTVVGPLPSAAASPPAIADRGRGRRLSRPPSSSKGEMMHAGMLDMNCRFIVPVPGGPGRGQPPAGPRRHRRDDGAWDRADMEYLYTEAGPRHRQAAAVEDTEKNSAGTPAAASPSGWPTRRRSRGPIPRASSPPNNSTRRWPSIGSKPASLVAIRDIFKLRTVRP